MVQNRIYVSNFVKKSASVCIHVYVLCLQVFFVLINIKMLFRMLFHPGFCDITQCINHLRCQHLHYIIFVISTKSIVCNCKSLCVFVILSTQALHILEMLFFKLHPCQFAGKEKCICVEKCSYIQV